MEQIIISEPKIKTPESLGNSQPMGLQLTQLLAQLKSIQNPS